MSSTENHKKAIKITASCRGKKGALTAIYYKILEDHPAAIVNAAAALERTVIKFPGKMPDSMRPENVTLESLAWGSARHQLYQCPDCKEWVDKIGIAGACIKCDVAGFDGHH